MSFKRTHTRSSYCCGAVRLFIQLRPDHLYSYCYSVVQLNHLCCFLQCDSVIYELLLEYDLIIYLVIVTVLFDICETFVTVQLDHLHRYYHNDI